MKKRLVLICAILLLLQSACAKDGGHEENESSESSALKLAPEDRSQTLNCTIFFETAEAYYYGDFYFIYFCPRGGTKFQALCSKPNCKHAAEGNPRNCNAWVGDLCACGYYNGAIYYLEDDGWGNELSLCRMELDGTGHQVVANLKFDDGRLLRCGIIPVFHHGKLIIRWIDDTSPLEEQQDYLTVVELSDYSYRDILEDYLQMARLPWRLVYYKDKLYGDGTGKQQYDCEPDDFNWVELDMSSEKGRTLFPKYRFNSENAGILDLYVTDDTLYYYECLDNRESFGDAADSYVPGFREYDLKTGEIRDCGNPPGADDIVYASYDDDFIYALSFVRNEKLERTIYFLSRDYKLLDQIEMKDGIGLVAVASDRIFFSGNGMPIGYYLDKSQIGTHDMRLKTMEMLDVKMDYGE